jgi:nicotinamidase-related amidase
MALHYNRAMCFAQMREAAHMTHSEGSQSALVVIDVQRALFEKSTPVYGAEALLCNINALIHRAHQQGIPVFFFRHSNQSFLAHGSDGWQFHPALKLDAADILLEKTHGSAFQDTCFHQALQERKISRLVVTGLVTNGCVRATCEDARKRGYTVVLVKDGHSSYQRDAVKIIDEWNERLCAQGIELLTAEAVQF